MNALLTFSQGLGVGLLATAALLLVLGRQPAIAAGVAGTVLAIGGSVTKQGGEPL
ncbi:hypothetical protein [Halorubrum sp. Atlit-26R]|uniref:hypothetical protein n=1 Tax=Halorubrum sp. Atlit-26R TaxID=2282128 RepID=UPI001313E99B|nr:hypothetical protein [Halorubrum sp. Atlit-26R]